MNVYFNVAPGARLGRIEKEGTTPATKGVLVSITPDEARALWEKVGTITDMNMAFRRLAVDFDFDVAACLEWYKQQENNNAP